ncbi:hypothetical protein ACJIZ3_003884 [Penstemon smallii]|uniref:Uncharacterized protein n=1 Tax=Penstemon smallii TaxID=265156 RepID=A0ABD3S0H3_9LAMI
MENSSGNGSGSGVIYTKERRGVKMEIPFTLKVGQVFTGFGIGCGVGIGVGRPLNLGAIPVLNQVMSATRGATDAFSGVQGFVNKSLRKVGAKNIEAGIGCGLGFGHGFGVGLAVKPGVLHQIQSNVLKAITGLMTNVGIDPTSSVSQSILPSSLQTGTSPLVKSVSNSNSTYEGNTGNGKTIVSLEKTLATKSAALNTQYSSKTEEVIDNFLKSPLLKEEGSSLHEQARPQQLENHVLQMVLKHQLLIEELMQENEKLRQILVEEMKVQPNKFHSSFTTRNQMLFSDFLLWFHVPGNLNSGISSYSIIS